MFNSETKKYFIWTKHYTDLVKSDMEIVKVCDDSSYSVIVHPEHEPVILTLDRNIVEQVKNYEKSTQLYFFGLVWFDFATLDNHGALLNKVLIDICTAVKPRKERLHRDMIWDDHALSERVSVLSTILSSDVIDDLSIESVDAVKSSLILCNDVLLDFVNSDHWANNNHRIFHLCGRIAYCHSLGDNFELSSNLSLLEATINNLFQIETGLSVEQSISYYSFDLILLNKVAEFVELISAEIKNLNYSVLFEKNRKAMSFLSFPDGEFPASGDTPLGFFLKNRIVLDQNDIQHYNHYLAELGHYRLESSQCNFSAHMISHNAESAHGHNSPLHTDIWSDKVGSFLVDSGGPYLYGNPLRYEWFRNSKAHNCLSVYNADIEKTSSKIEYVDDVTICGVSENPLYSHERTVRLLGNAVEMCETVRSLDNWFLSYHFAPGNLFLADENVLIYTKNNSSIKILLDTNCKFRIAMTHRTFGRGNKTEAPSIIVEGDSGSHVVIFKVERNL